MRINEIVESNKNMAEKAKLNTEAGRQMAILSVLTDISETLALMLDVYSNVHGREVTLKRKDENDANG